MIFSIAFNSSLV